MSHYVEFSELTKTYPTAKGPAVIVKDFNLKIAQGEFAALIEQYEEGRRQKKELEKKKQKWERIKAEMIDEQINSLSAINQGLVDALFLVNGFHLHKRQWRKKRND